MSVSLAPLNASLLKNQPIEVTEPKSVNVHNQPSDPSSFHINKHEDDDITDIDVCPSPSPSKSISQSPESSMSSSETSIEESNHKELESYSDDDATTQIKNCKKDGQTNTMQSEHEQHTHSDSESREYSISMSTCRYCYSDIPRIHNVSSCYCTGMLCKDCLIRELKLTHNRADNTLQCTVCKKEYEVETEFSFDVHTDCKRFCIDTLVHCGLKDEQYLLDSYGGKVGFFLVILGINTWILSTSLLFAFPPNGCPIELYFMVSMFDFAVGVSTIWFIIKCRYLSPLLLGIMYFVRSVYILLGWIPSVNLCNIYVYHHEQSNHVSILAYFLSFSLIASVVMCVCWMSDYKSQYTKYTKEHGKLVLNAPNNVKIEVNDIAMKEQDSF